jgi:hypothetical protein
MDIIKYELAKTKSTCSLKTSIWLRAKFFSLVKLVKLVKVTKTYISNIPMGQRESTPLEINVRPLVAGSMNEETTKSLVSW